MQPGHPPPQSVSVSAPFRTKSVHVAVWQVVLHTLLWQSPGAPHTCPAPQRAAHAAPPQSTPVSSWLDTPSVQVAA